VKRQFPIPSDFDSFDPDSEDETGDSEDRHAVKRHHAPGHDTDSDEEAEEQCQALVYPCFAELAPYLEAENTAEMLKNTPLRTQCRVAVSVRNCLREAIESQECTRHFDEDDEQVLRLISFMGGIIRFVCEDRLDDFETHQACFRAAKFDHDVEECRITNFDETDKCNPSRFTACTDAAIDGTIECGPGAKELMHDFIREILSYIPECEVPGMKFMKKVMMKRWIK
jgi:hypothetical protein